MDTHTTDDGETLRIARNEGDRGSKAPFFVAYRSNDREEKYGWFCGHCESVDNAMDAMGRIQCNRCGNFRKPTEWDAAHE